MPKQYRQYTVTITPTAIIAGASNQSEEMDFTAQTAADAVKQARRHMTDVVGHDPKVDGKLLYKARLTSK